MSVHNKWQLVYKYKVYKYLRIKLVLRLNKCTQ